MQGLADCNPFGLALLLTYKFGSARMGSRFTCDLRWVGLRPSQLNTLHLQPQALQKLTDRDRSRMTSLMNLLRSNDGMNDACFVKIYCDELKLMMAAGIKCELEALVSRSYDLSTISTLSDFLERQITQRKFI